MENNEYDDLILESEQSTAQGLQASAFANQNTEPDRKAEAMKLAQQYKVPVEFAERNFDDFKKKSLNSEDVYEDLAKNYEKTSEFMQDPNNFGLAKDDVDTLKTFEKNAEPSFWESIGDDLIHGSAGMAKGALGFQQMARELQDDYPILKGPINASGAGLWFSDQGFVSRDNITSGRKYLGSVQEERDTLKNETRGIIESATAGDFWSASKILAHNIIRAIPQLASVAVNPALGLTGMFATESGEKYVENKEEGISTGTAAVNAIATGAVSAAIESVGGFGAKAGFKEIIQEAAQKLGKESVMQITKRSMMEILKVGGSEGLEESATELAQAVVDYGMGVNDNAFENIGSRMGDSFLIGMGTGSSLGAVSQAASVAQFKKQQLSQHASDIYEKMGITALESKLFKRSPEKFAEFAQKATEKIGADQIHLSVEDVKEYFQSKNLDAAEEMTKLGFGSEFKEASETHGEIVLPTGQWLTKTATTEHYAGLKEDVRFSAEEMSPKQIKAEKKKSAEELKALNEKIQQEETEGSEIITDIYNQLVSTGLVEKNEAKPSAQVFRFFQVMAQRSGISPLELYNRYGVKIMAGKEPVMGNQPADLPFVSQPDNLVSLQKNEYGQYDYHPEVMMLLKNSIEQSEAGQRMMKEDGSFMGTASTFPEFFKNKGYTKKAVMKIFENLETGKALSERQTEILNDLYEGAADKYNRKEMFQSNKNRAQAMGYDTSKTLFHSSEKQFKAFKASNRGALGPGVYTYTDSPDNVNAIESLKNEYGPVSYSLYRKSGKVLESKDIYTVEQIEYVKKIAKELDLPSNIRQIKSALDKAKKGLNSYQHAYSLLHDAAVNKYGIDKVGYYGTSDFIPKLLQKHGYVAVRGQLNDNEVEVVLDPKHVRSTDAAFNEDDPKDIYKQGYKGSFTPDANIIKLFQSKDQSTFLHESGHLFLEVIGDLALAENAADGIKSDYKEILNWLGVNSREEIKVEHHEKWARGFEAYLMQGKAPTPALRKAFNTFKIWLTKIYKKASSLNVELNPTITGVMDRLLASEEEINSAQAELNLNALLKDPISAGMSEDQAAKYKEALEEARLYAEAKLNEKLLNDLNRQQSREYKEKFDQYYHEFRKELMQNPVYRAIDTLRSTNKDDLVKIKLDKQSVIDRMGQEVADLLPHGVTGKEGLDYALVGEMFGFESGENFITEMVQAPNITDAARKAANDRLKTEFPDLFKDPEIKAEAKMALHNEKRSLALKYELEYLETKYKSTMKDAIRRIVKRSPPDQLIREQAAKIVGALNTKDLKPHLYLRAETKASKEAGEKLAKGDIKGAFEAKRMEYLNHELYRAVVEAQADVKKTVKDYKKIFEKNEDLSKKRDVDLVSTARAILAQFGVIKANAEDPFSYLAKIEKYDPAQFGVIQPIVESAIQDSGPYSDIPYDKFVEVKDTVQALWDLAKNVRQMEVDGKAVELEEAAGELVLQMGKHSSGEVPKAIKQDLSNIEKFKVSLLGAKASLTRVESWTDLMDLGELGPFKKYIWQPVSESITKYRLKKNDVITEYKNITQEYKDIFTGEAIVATELDGYVFKSKAHLLMALLHTGNQSNKSKLLRGRNWGVVNEDGSIDSSQFDAMIKRFQGVSQAGVQNQFDTPVLTKRDYEFCQKIWDLMESLKPDAQKAHRKMYGYYFNEITAQEIETPFGNFKGGYIPAKVDVYTNEDADIREQRNELENNNNSFQFPTTGRGFTKSRVDAYAAPLSLEMNLLASHIDGVLRFTHVEPVIKQVSRLVMDKGFRSNLFEIDPQIAREMLVPWLQRAATQKVVVPSDTAIGKIVDSGAAYLRTSVAMQFMVGNITNALQQVTGILVAAAKVPPKKLVHAMHSYVMNRKETLNSIYEKSEFMRANQGVSIYEAQGQINEVIVNPSVFENTRNFAKTHTYFLQAGTQNMVNTIVWQGAYNDAVEKKMSEVEAVRAADAAVRLTQGTNNPEDISRFETGTASYRLFTQFAGYFNMLANLNQTEIKKIARTVGLKKGAGKLFYLYTMSFMLPAVLSEVLVQGMRGTLGDDEDDDGHLDEILMMFFGSQAKLATAMIPFAGTILNSAANRFNDVAYDDRLSFSPVLSVLETSLGVPAAVYKMADKEEIKKQGVKDILQLIGIATQLPTGPIGKPVGYLMDVDSGKADPSGPVDFTRGLVTGQAGE